MMNKRILIVGSNGLLGQKAVEVFKENSEVFASGIEPAPFVDQYLPYLKLDITNEKDVHHVAEQIKPDIIFNAAAYTQVDKAEQDRELCFAINVTGVKNLAAATANVQATLVHVSTDYVFDGKKGNFSETDEPNPLGYYGLTKLQGEQEVAKSGCSHIIARTAVLFGCGAKIQINFALWALNQLQNRKPLRVVDDQIGSPTIADNLALAIAAMLAKGARGLFHVAGREAISRYHFTLAIAEKFGLDSALVARIKSTDFPQKAPRPMNASLNVDKALALGIPLFNVDESLAKLKETLKM